MSDLAAARDDLGAFASIVGHPLADWQARSLDLATRTTAILAPRQTGKSRSLALLALHRAFRSRGQRVLIVSAGEDASRRLLTEVRRIAADSPLLRGSVVDEQAGLLTLSNGSEVRSVPASERQVRGWSVDLLLIDEAALVSDDVALGAALPTTAARPDARIVLASTPWAQGGFFHSHVVAGDSEHLRVHRWRIEDAAWISPTAIEAARTAMSPARFAAEYEAAWTSDAAAMFSRAVLERVTADLELPTLDRLRGPARLLGGVDWGVSTDRSAFVAIARLPVAHLNTDRSPTEPAYVVACSRAWPAGEPLSNVARAIAATPAHLALLSSETNGVGAGPTQELFRLCRDRPWDAGGGSVPRFVAVEEGGEQSIPQYRPRRRRGDRARGFVTKRNPVHTTAATKAHVYERLRWLADQERLILPRDAELLRELAALRIELRPSGTESIEAGAGHDDLADALYLAAGPARSRCLLADLASRGRTEAEVADLDEPVIETGDGLRVYRRPPLQSVNGPALTIPEGVTESVPTDPVLDELRTAARRALDNRDRQEARSA